MHGNTLRAFVAVGIAAVCVLGIAVDAAAQGRSGGAPPGQPFQALQAQIDELRALLEEKCPDDGSTDPDQPRFEAVTVDTSVFFGDGDCSIGIVPGLPGLTETDPGGFRLLGTGQDGTGGRLVFGPTELCAIQIDPFGVPGLQFLDPNGVNLLNPLGDLEPVQLNFGPTGLCTIKTRPLIADGLWFCDPNGIRVVNPLGDDQPTRLAFGTTNDCAIQVLPGGPGGLVLSDPRGVRIMPNPEDDDPPFPPLPFQLFFGPTDLCSIQVDPAPDGLSGLQLRDPNGVRILPAVQDANPRLIFGPTGECFIEAAERLGLFLWDPRGVIVNSPVLDVEGEVIAEEFVTRSSRELKRNIKPLEHALDTIGRLNGVSFEWKTDPEGKADIGFIAEEVAEVLPELAVKSSDGKSVEGLKYPNLVAVTVEGIKEQQGQIEAQKSQIESLREENRMLQEGLTAMQRQMAQMAETIAAVQPR